MDFQKKAVTTLAIPSDLVWIQTAFIGDIILTTGALKLAMEQWPDVRQHVVTTPAGYEILKDHPAIYSVVVFDKKKEPNRWKALKRVSEKVIDSLNGRANPFVLRAHRSLRSKILSSLIGVPSIGYHEGFCGLKSGVLVPRIASWHEVHRISLLLQPFGLSRQCIQSARPNLVSIKNEGISEKLNNLRSPIGIAPGSVWATKRWPLENFIELTQMLVSHGHDIVLLGGKEEEDLALAIEKVIPKNHQVVNLVGQTSLHQLKAVFPRLSVLVGNDSAPLHFASSFNIPAVAVFGATTSKMGFAPLSLRNKVLENSLSCRPCGIHGSHKCPKIHFRCMDIPPKAVFGAVLEMLGSVSSG